MTTSINDNDTISRRPGITAKRLHSMTCRDCGVAQGELHQPDCWRERCARCGGQAVSSGHDDDVAHFPRVPFILWANVCPGCGMLDPDMFDVPTRVWRHYIEPAHRGDVLCINCWDRIVTVIDDGRYQAQHGGPVALWCDAWKQRHPDIAGLDAAAD